MEFRHEIKFIVSDAQLALIHGRISPLMQKDSHQKKDSYTVTSIYFDDLDDTCLNENVNGNDLRDKYRIRIYNHDLGCIKLEKKSKIHTLTKKESALLDQDEFRKFLDHEHIRILPDYPARKKELFCEMRLKALLPKSIVEYDRSAYVFTPGNVRVTFDRNIRGTANVRGFRKGCTHMVPFLKSGVHILEVKYDRRLPQFISDSLEIGTLQAASFSKYCCSRNYGWFG